MPPPTWRTRRASSSAPASSRPVIPRSWTSRRRRSPSSACPSRPRWRATPSWRRRRDGGEDTRARRRPGRRARGGRDAGRGRGARGVGPRARPGRAASARLGAGGLRGGGGGARARRGRNRRRARHRRLRSRARRRGRVARLRRRALPRRPRRVPGAGAARTAGAHRAAGCADRGGRDRVRPLACAPRCGRPARWANAFAQASWTRPSVATILTGLYPSSHGAVHKADRLPERVDTLAERLRGIGYRTVGFADNANISQAFNFQQGFDEYRYLEPDFFFGASEPASQLALYSGLRLVRERFLAHSVDVHQYYQPAEVVTAEVRRWLDRGAGEQPFFLFVHYMDPHDPYFAHPFNGEGYARVAHPNPPPALAERLHRLYEGEVAYLDEHLGVLFDDLRRRGLYGRTLVVLTADHGEEFHEHGGWWHGTTLYDEQIHVPLIVKPPGAHGPGPTGGAGPIGGAGRVFEELATSLDIAPTILAAAGLTVQIGRAHV